MDLRLTDALSGRRRSLGPNAGRSVELYVCGPTVYAPAHVGHGRTLLAFDVARRTLEAEGVRVRHAMNVTDLEDKIDRRAQELGTSSRALARAEERAFYRDLRALGNLRPTYGPRASEFVPQMIDVARALARTGRVERQGDEWRYEAPARPPGRGFPSGDELARHAVAEPGHPFPATGEGGRSFAVWKRQEAPLPSWPSPWGRGVPGWHLQCYAMASRLLAVPLDLHGGGRDLAYPHHFAENEIALALRKRPFARCFVHTGLVLQDGSKMSKSVGNLVALRPALARFGAGGLRWYLLGRPYAERFPWEDREARAAADELARVRRTLRGWLGRDGGSPVRAREAERLLAGSRRALADGLAADQVVGAVRRFCARLARAPGEGIPRGERPRARQAVQGIAQRLGVSLA